MLDEGRLDLKRPRLARNRTAAVFRIETAEDLFREGISPQFSHSLIP